MRLPMQKVVPKEGWHISLLFCTDVSLKHQFQRLFRSFSPSSCFTLWSVQLVFYSNIVNENASLQLVLFFPHRFPQTALWGSFFPFLSSRVSSPVSFYAIKRVIIITLRFACSNFTFLHGRSFSLLFLFSNPIFNLFGIGILFNLFSHWLLILLPQF